MGRSGGGSSSGGGRSFGGGGSSRSSGGFSNSSGRSGRSSSSSSHSSYRSGGSGLNVGYGYNSGPRFLGGMRFGRSRGFGVASSVIVVVLMFAVSAFMSIVSSSSKITPSTYAREKLPSTYANVESFYYDEDDWIHSKSTLREGMQAFYNKTGVAPFIYITDGTKGTTSNELSQFTQEVYDKLFTDEAHFIVAIYDDGDGRFTCGYTCGAEAKTVMDEEAVDIFFDYMTRYYSSDKSDEEFISCTFESTANRIMSKTTPIKNIIVIGVIVLVVCVAGVIALSMFIKYKHKRDEDTINILNADIDEL